MIGVYRMSEAQLNAWLMGAVPRNKSRSGGLISFAQIEPISAGRVGQGRRMKRTHTAKRRTFRDFN
jgi:hypothetical protein